MAKTRPEDWIGEAFRVLVESGADGLSAEHLSTRLGVTRGSFYHHFGSREGFIRAVLSRWEDGHTERVIAMSRAGGSPEARLDRLIEYAWSLPHDLDVAIRAWALRDPVAREFQARVDRRRLDYTVELYNAFTSDQETGRQLARMAYYSFIGVQQIEPQLRGEELERFIEGMHRILFSHTSRRTESI